MWGNFSARHAVDHHHRPTATKPSTPFNASMPIPSTAKSCARVAEHALSDYNETEYAARNFRQFLFPDRQAKGEQRQRLPGALFLLTAAGVEIQRFPLRRKPPCARSPSSSTRNKPTAPGSTPWTVLGPVHRPLSHLLRDQGADQNISFDRRQTVRRGDCPQRQVLYGPILSTRTGCRDPLPNHRA